MIVLLVSYGGTVRQHSMALFQMHMGLCMICIDMVFSCLWGKRKACEPLIKIAACRWNRNTTSGLQKSEPPLDDSKQSSLYLFVAIQWLSGLSNTKIKAFGCNGIYSIINIHYTQVNKSNILNLLLKIHSYRKPEFTLMLCYS